MSMTPSERELLRYLLGEATPDEQERVEAWLAEDPDRWARLAALRNERADAALNESAVRTAKAEVWARLRHHVAEAGELTGGRRKRSREFAPSLLSPRLSRTPLVAALVLVAVGLAALGGLLLRWQPRSPSQTERVAATTPGQRAMFRLPDGTRVMLGVASTLRYPIAFPSASREVSLEGEAYFEVVHDARRPFAVRAGDLVATDIGTEFTVRMYPEDDGARVVVREGRVAIRAVMTGSAEQIVAPGQLGRLGRDRRPRVEPADTAVWFGWTEGRLALDAVPLREALPQLSRWFGLEFRLADSVLGEVPLSATLRTRPTPEVLNNLAASLGMRQRRSGQVVTLYPARPGGSAP